MRCSRRLILSEGSPTDGLYVVLEGEIRLGPGRCLGEYGVIDDRPSSASAEAVAPAKLCFLSKAEFRRLVERHDRVGRIVYANLLHYLVSRLRGKDKELDIFLLAEK